jgi:tetratricopeptide (TPR) repeat protein
MRQLHRAALWAAFLGLAAPSAGADIVLLKDGKAAPPKFKLAPGTEPTEEELEESGRDNLELAYDAAKVGGTTVRPADVVKIWSTSALANEPFKTGMRNAASGFFDVAAGDFQSASEELKGAAAKQLALYNRLLCLANTNDLAGTLSAADDFLAAFPKTYYYGPVQQMRAKILANQNNMPESAAALKAVVDAPGMNARDRYECEVTRIFLTEYSKAGKDKAKYAAAEKSYRALVDAIERDRDKADAEAPRLKALVGVGKCLVFQGKPSDARKSFESVIAAPVAARDHTLLGAAYSGLGNVVFAEAQEAQSKAAGNEEQKKKARALLDDAALHYLRVAVHYKDAAEVADLYNAKLNLARVFATVFTLSGDKDCDLGRRAYTWFGQAVDMLPQGEERRQRVQEGKDLKQRLDQNCK